MGCGDVRARNTDQRLAMSRYLVAIDYGDEHQEFKVLYSRRELNTYVRMAKAKEDVEYLVVYRDPAVISIWSNPNCSPETKFT